jgi:tungstate transport system ATP-binding protein
MVAPILPLILTSIEVRRSGRTILGPLSHRLEGAGISILMGPNGSGKTTLLKTMHGIERPSRGQIDWQITAEEARLRQAFVFQTPTILRRSVLDNIAFPLLLRGIFRKKAQTTAAELGETVGLGKVLQQSAMVLSGGEKQKLAIARALILAPDVLFLDEPCANLDSRATRDIEAILCNARDKGTRIVMATHDHGQARRLADEIWFLHAGKLLESTPKNQFFEAPQSSMARAYLKGDLLP